MRWLTIDPSDEEVNGHLEKYPYKGNQQGDE
jgi:hypothetical protein